MSTPFRALRGILPLLALFLVSGEASAFQAPAPPAAGPPYRVGGEVTRPERISGETPVYTEIARRARVMGVVILEAIIDEQGNVAETRLLKGLPMGLDRAAVEAVRTWKFQPATLKGEPVPVYYVLTVNFQVTDDPDYGPQLETFLQESPELGELVQSKSYKEAEALLDRWAAERPEEPRIRLARAYILLQQERVSEAWQEVQAYDGPSPYEILRSIGVLALHQVSSQPSPSEEDRREIIEGGLQATARALEANKDDPTALGAQSRLLQEKAKLPPR